MWLYTASIFCYADLNEVKNVKLRLRSLRDEVGITQQELADKLFLTQKTINSYETGRTQPNIETLCKIANIFETSVDYLIGNSDVRYSYSLAGDKNLKEKEKFLLKHFQKLSEETQDNFLHLILACQGNRK